MAIRRITTTGLLVPAAVLASAFGLALSGCGSSSSSSSGSSQEAQSAATGDIPDNQNFLRFQNRQAGYSIQYPEGWAQKGSAADVTFSDKLNSVHILIGSGKAPSVSSVAAELRKGSAKNPALKAQTPQRVTISGAPAIHVVYDAQSKPDPVTGKRTTLMVDRYVLANNGNAATVDLATPQGVDNVDAYRLMIHSFRWS